MNIDFYRTAMWNLTLHFLNMFPVNVWVWVFGLIWQRLFWWYMFNKRTTTNTYSCFVDICCWASMALLFLRQWQTSSPFFGKLFWDTPVVIKAIHNARIFFASHTCEISTWCLFIPAVYHTSLVSIMLEFWTWCFQIQAVVISTFLARLS